MCDFKIKRGDVVYYVANEAVGSEQKIGRPMVVVSSNRGNESSRTINACYLTTSMRWGKVNVPVLSTPKPSWAMCNQIVTIDKSRDISYMCTVSDSEMEEIDRGLMIALGLHEWEEPEEKPEEKSDELLELEVKYDLLKEKYITVLKKLAEGQIEKDLQSVAAPTAVEAPKKLAEGQIEINSCSVADLRSIGVSSAVIKCIMGGRPWQSMDDLRRIPGMTGILYGVLVKKATCIPGAKPVAERTPRVKTEKVNVNTASAQEIAKAIGRSMTTAYSITGYRNKHGKFEKLEDLLKVNQVSEKMLAECRGKICV